LSSTTTPSDTQAEAIVDEISFEIDAKLASVGVSVIPATDPSYFVGWLKLLNMYGAAAAILKSMFPASVGAGETPAWAFWESRYNKGMKSLEDGSAIPPGIASSSRVTPSAYGVRFPQEDAVLGPNAEPFFKRSKQF
jgi:hypothetical protein